MDTTMGLFSWFFNGGKRESQEGRRRITGMRKNFHTTSGQEYMSSGIQPLTTAFYREAEKIRAKTRSVHDAHTSSACSFALWFIIRPHFRPQPKHPDVRSWHNCRITGEFYSIELLNSLLKLFNRIEETWRIVDSIYT